MRSLKQLAVAGILVALMTSVCGATALYQAAIAGSLQIRSIARKSMGLPGSSSDVPDFTITVDPLFQNPNLLIVESPILTGGFGDYTAEASTRAEIFAVDPFDIDVNDSVSIYARAVGSHGRTTNSRSESSAAITATLFLVNESSHEMFVDARWGWSGSQISLASGPDGEAARADVDLIPRPTGDLLGMTPVTYSVGPGTVGEIQLFAAASGFASAPEAIPEPTSIVIWIACGVLGTLTWVTRRERMSTP